MKCINENCRYKDNGICGNKFKLLGISICKDRILPIKKEQQENEDQ